MSGEGREEMNELASERLPCAKSESRLKEKVARKNKNQQQDEAKKRLTKRDGERSCGRGHSA